MKTEYNGMRLYDKNSQRLYINRFERKDFEKVAKQQSTNTKLLCLTLLYTGCRLSEALNLRRCDLQVRGGLIAITSLKKRDKHHVREVNVPMWLVRQLDAAFCHQDPTFKLWPLHRSTAWRRVKKVMDKAGIVGVHATAKGLRHSFGALGAYLNIDLPLSQKWMGHSDARVTAIYRQLVGRDEREVASRMWK